MGDGDGDGEEEDEEEEPLGMTPRLTRVHMPEMARTVRLALELRLRPRRLADPVNMVLIIERRGLAWAGDVSHAHHLHIVANALPYARWTCVSVHVA